MATQDDRSINSGGISLPMWMKTKMNDTLNLEQNAFSPTELDDSFMFFYKSGFSRGSSEPPVDNKKVNLVEAAKTIQTAPVSNNAQRPDFSKHTPFCQRYLTGNAGPTKPATTLGGQATKIKSSGVDDGFKGEAAKCGTSVIKVANQMVAGKVVYGFDIAKNNDCGGNGDDGGDVLDGPPKGFNPLTRRDSKSLPASPLGSPKGSRKNVNKYFTSPFVDNENHHGSRILANLLGRRQQQTLSQSVGHIPEDEATSGLKSQYPNVSLVDVAGADDGAKKAAKNPVLVAKPSELREMNFWSPTSM